MSAVVPGSSLSKKAPSPWVPLPVFSVSGSRVFCRCLQISLPDRDLGQAGLCEWVGRPATDANQMGDSVVGSRCTKSAPFFAPCRRESQAFGRIQPDAALGASCCWGFVWEVGSIDGLAVRIPRDAVSSSHNLSARGVIEKLFR
jgi:hypothetical protein